MNSPSCSPPVVISGGFATYPVTVVPTASLQGQTVDADRLSTTTLLPKGAGT